MTRLSSDRSFIHSVVKACDNNIIAGLIFNRIDWSVDHHRTNNETRFFFKGHWWMYDTIPDFLAALDYCSERTMKNAFAKLKKKKLILHCRVRSKNWDQTNFYTVNYEEYKKLGGRICTLAPSLVYNFDAIEKLRFTFCLLANCFDLAVKAKVQILHSRTGKICTLERANFAPSSLSFIPSVQSEPFNPNNRGGKSAIADPPSNLIQISEFKGMTKEEKNAAYEEMESLWPILDDFEYEAPEGQTKEERKAIKDKASKRVDELMSLLDKSTKLENSKTSPPKPDSGMGDSWLALILKTYPNSKYTNEQLDKIAGKSAAVMRGLHIEFGFPVVLSWVGEYGSDYLKEKFFKSPRSILVRDLEGNTFLEEAIGKTRDNINRVVKKSKVKRW